MKELAYRNENYEKQIEQELASALDASNRLLHCWLSLDLGALNTTLFELAYRTPAVYKEAVQRVSGDVVSLGRYAIRPGVLLDLLEIPIPNELYLAAKQVKLQTQCGHPELWSISPDGKTVILNQELADQLIHANDIWITSKRQREFLDHCIAFQESSNWLYDNLLPLPGMMTKFGPPFALIARSSMQINKYEIDPIQLNVLIQSIE
jgi:hypothetical protein